MLLGGVRHCSIHATCMSTQTPLQRCIQVTGDVHAFPKLPLSRWTSCLHPWSSSCGCTSQQQGLRSTTQPAGCHIPQSDSHAPGGSHLVSSGDRHIPERIETTALHQRASQYAAYNISNSNCIKRMLLSSSCVSSARRSALCHLSRPTGTHAQPLNRPPFNTPPRTLPLSGHGTRGTPPLLSKTLQCASPARILSSCTPALSPPPSKWRPCP